MRATDALGELLKMRRPIFETHEAAARLDLSTSAASRLLRSMEQAGLVQHLRHGLWSLEANVEPFTVAPYLTRPFPAYVSLWTALARYGMIEQIPRRIFVISLDRSRDIGTELGTYSIHHLAPELFTGYESPAKGIYVASPEKALFDTVYIRAARGGAIRFPELELPVTFRKRRLSEWTKLIARPRLRTLVTRGLERALAEANS